MMSIKNKIAIALVGGSLITLGGIIVALRFAGGTPQFLRLLGVGVATMTLFDLILIRAIPQIWNERTLRRGCLVITLPGLPISIGMIAWSYHQGLYFGLSFVAAIVVFKRVVRKSLRQALAELRELAQAHKQS
jgi:hypothetical protein